MLVKALNEGKGDPTPRVNASSVQIGGAARSLQPRVRLRGVRGQAGGLSICRRAIAYRTVVYLAS